MELDYNVPDKSSFTYVLAQCLIEFHIKFASCMKLLVAMVVMRNIPMGSSLCKVSHVGSHKTVSNPLCHVIVSSPDYPRIAKGSLGTKVKFLDSNTFPWSEFAHTNQITECSAAQVEINIHAHIAATCTMAVERVVRRLGASFPAETVKVAILSAY